MSLTDSNHDLPIAPNRLRDLAAPTRRDAVWIADITYVKTNEGFLYVAGVLDRCTRRCLGWAMGGFVAHFAATGGTGHGVATRPATSRTGSSFGSRGAIRQ